MSQAKNKKPAPLSAPLAANVDFDASMFETVADIVLPSISLKGMEEGDKLYITVESEIRKVEQSDEKTGRVKMEKFTQVDETTGEETIGKRPAMLPLVNAVNLATKQRGQLVIPTIVLRGFEAAGTLTGRSFVWIKGRSLGTGKANLWEVKEVRAKA